MKTTNNIIRKYIDITEGQNVFFASDFHFWHNNVIKFDNRPFENVVDMNNTIIKNWQDTVRHTDIVFYLGDLSFAGFNKTKNIVTQLPGQIYHILGNHDKFKEIDKLDYAEQISDYAEIWINDGTDTTDRNSKGKYQHICLSHYPLLVWNKHHRGSWMLHGHSHQNLKKGASGKEFYKRKVDDMGTNGWDYTPASFAQIKDMMNKKDIVNVDHHGSK